MTGAAHFSAAPPKQLADDVVWHPSGWHTPEGEVRMPVDREFTFTIDARGRTRFYYEGRRWL